MKRKRGEDTKEEESKPRNRGGGGQTEKTGCKRAK